MLYLLETEDDEVQSRFVVSLLSPEEIQTRDLPGYGIVGSAKKADDNSGIKEFVANPEFVKLLQRVVERYASSVPSLLEEARRQKNGIVYVIDGRVKDISGAIQPEDILGAFEVREGQIHPETYRSNPNYQLYTSEGFFVLHPKILEKVCEAIKAGSLNA